MSAKHTAGPWVVALLPDDGGPSIHTAGYGISRRIAGVDSGGWTKTPLDEANANARLIAAAPDLLAALRELVRANTSWNAAVESCIGRPVAWTDDYLDAARAAIAKSEGE